MWAFTSSLWLDTVPYQCHVQPCVFNFVFDYTISAAQTVTACRHLRTARVRLPMMANASGVRVDNLAFDNANYFRLDLIKVKALLMQEAGPCTRVLPHLVILVCILSIAGITPNPRSSLDTAKMWLSSFSKAVTLAQVASIVADRTVSSPLLWWSPLRQFL